ncbi:MAG: lipid ABC transporter permease/ATP-binding protein, partial [Candidatus Dadabacteria bacterium]|nr:lipid ABC transporter permease/ATP-binding protein [Candidatus Dadabacteria bacterium]
MKPLLDGAFIEKDPDMMFWVPIMLVGLFFIRGIASYISVSTISWVANKVITDLRSQMFSRLLSFPSQFFDNHTTGSLMSKFTYDATQVKQASTIAITTIIRDSLAVLGLLGWMLYINWKLTLIALIATPFIAIVILIIRIRLRKMSQKV